MQVLTWAPCMPFWGGGGTLPHSCCWLVPRHVYPIRQAAIPSQRPPRPVLPFPSLFHVLSFPFLPCPTPCPSRFILQRILVSGLLGFQLGWLVPFKVRSLVVPADAERPRTDTGCH